MGLVVGRFSANATVAIASMNMIRNVFMLTPSFSFLNHFLTRNPIQNRMKPTKTKVKHKTSNVNNNNRYRIVSGGFRGGI